MKKSLNWAPSSRELPRSHQNGVQKSKGNGNDLACTRYCLYHSTLHMQISYGILNMNCIRFLRCPISFNVGRVWFSSWLLLVSTTRVHVARRRWPATYLVGTRHCVGCTVSGISSRILRDAHLGRERKRREATCCGTAVWPEPPLLAATRFAKISPEATGKVFSEAEALHCLSTGPGASRVLHQSFCFGLEMLVKKNWNCLIYFWLKVFMITVQFVRSLLC